MYLDTQHFRDETLKLGVLVSFRNGTSKAGATARLFPLVHRTLLVKSNHLQCQIVPPVIAFTLSTQLARIGIRHRLGANALAMSSAIAAAEKLSFVVDARVRRLKRD